MTHRNLKKKFLVGNLEKHQEQSGDSDTFDRKVFYSQSTTQSGVQG